MLSIDENRFKQFGLKLLFEVYSNCFESNAVRDLILHGRLPSSFIRPPFLYFIMSRMALVNVNWRRPGEILLFCVES